MLIILSTQPKFQWQTHCSHNHKHIYSRSFFISPSCSLSPLHTDTNISKCGLTANATTDFLFNVFQSTGCCSVTQNNFKNMTFLKQTLPVPRWPQYESFQFYSKQCSFFFSCYEKTTLEHTRMETLIRFRVSSFTGCIIQSCPNYVDIFTSDKLIKDWSLINRTASIRYMWCPQYSACLNGLISKEENIIIITGKTFFVAQIPCHSCLDPSSSTLGCFDLICMLFFDIIFEKKERETEGERDRERDITTHPEWDAFMHWMIILWISLLFVQLNKC